MEKNHKILKGIYKNTKSIRTQLFVMFIIINFITLTLCTMILYSVSKNIITKDFKDSNLKQTQNMSNIIGNILENVNNISMLVGTNQKIQDQMDFNDISSLVEIRNSKEVFKLFEDYINNYTYIDSIYCYVENDTIIGKDGITNLFLANSTKQDFDKNLLDINSYIVKTSNMHPNQQIFSAEFQRINFDYIGDIAKNKTENLNYISFFRSFNYPQELKHDLTVCINIKETYFRSIYDSDVENNKKLTYIINSDGKISSHPNLSRINTMSLSFHKDKMKDNYGTFTFMENSEKMQVVFSKIPNSSLILIIETPINTIIEGVSLVRKYFIALLIANILLAFILSMFFIRRITDPLSKLTYSMYKMEQGDLKQKLEDLPNNEIGILNRQFNRMSKSVIELIVKNKAIEEEKRKLEIQNLQAQINPHFLYNTLNTFKWMALLVDAKEVAEGLTAMGNLLYPVYQNKGELWTIREEHNFIQNYIKIMNYRYGGGVAVTVTFPEEVMDYMVLTFIIQPILENTFLHGLKVQSTFGEISVNAWADGESVNIEIKDNGNGINEEKLCQIKQSLIEEKQIYGADGIGISNVNRRIRLHCGNQYGINITSEVGIGTNTLLRLPKILNKSINFNHITPIDNI